MGKEKSIGIIEDNQMEKTTFGIVTERCHRLLEGFEQAFEQVLLASDSKKLFDENPIENVGGYEKIAVDFVNNCALKVENKGRNNLSFKEAVANEIATILSSYKVDKNFVCGLPIVKINHGNPASIHDYPELTEAFLKTCVSTIRQMEQNENIAEKHLLSRLQGW